MTDEPVSGGGWLDYNDAEPQYLISAAAYGESTEETKARLLSDIRNVLAYLLPAGTFQRDTFVVGDVNGSRGDSLVVELTGPKAGMWHDFATGEGSDIIGLWAAVTERNTGADFPAVMDDIRTWLGGSSRPRHCETKTRSERRLPPKDYLGPVTAKWDYLDEDGRLVACVYRYDPPDGKQFRPWDVKARKMKAPEPRPLYNRPGIKVAEEVILVEGEKAAEALIQRGICATTAMNGAKAPVHKTDWSPLNAKRVAVWPDKDGPGWDYAMAAARAIIDAGAASVSVLMPPDDRPEKWDAADAVAEDFDVAAFIATAERQSVQREQVFLSSQPDNPALDITAWDARRYAGPAPEQRFLVEACVPMGVVSILAAMGDSGKGMMLLNLALSVATGEPSALCGSPEPMAFGGAVHEFGTAIIFTAEDDKDEIHRRLQHLDPEEFRLIRPERLLVVPLPNAGGPLPLVAAGKDGPEVTEQFRMIRDQIGKLPDLKLVVFDPLASFIHADVNSDPAAGSYATGLLASLATETGASVIVAHHMRKPHGSRPITSAEQARDAVRGTSAIVDGVRMVYALWPAPEEYQDGVFKALDEPFARNAVFQGAVVKANGPADRTIRTYLRAPTGLLVDMTQRLRDRRLPEEELVDTLVMAIARAAENGHPFTHTGASGVHQQRHRLPPVFHDMGRNRLHEMVQGLLNQRPPALVKGMASGSKEHRWLDVPNGPFARGKGEFVHGADEVSE